MRTIILSLIFLPLTSFQLSAQLWTLDQKMGSSDHQAGDNLGISLAVSDTFMIAGAWFEDHDENGDNRISESGSAYIYKLNAAGQWEEIQKLASPNRDRSDYYGFAVDIDGDLAVVGSYNEDTNVGGNVGRAYVYRRDPGDQWVLEDTLEAADAAIGDVFGKAVALSGDYALIGSPQNQTDENSANSLAGAGAAYLFKRDANQSWSQIAKLVPQDRAIGDAFGASVALDGFSLLICALEKDESNLILRSGLVYGTYFETANAFEQISNSDLQRIFASRVGGRDLFGNGLAISGAWAFLGAAAGEADDSGFGRANGHGYFYKWENGSWVEKQVVFPPDPDNSGSFGFAADMDQGVAVVGAASATSDAMNANPVAGAGAAHIYELQPDDSWLEVEKISGSERNFLDNYGAAVGISGDRIWVGAWDADTVNGTTLLAGGALYSYQRAWALSVNELAKLNHLEIQWQNEQGQILVRNNGGEMEKMQASLFSLDGRQIWSSPIEIKDRWERRFTEIPAGLYLFHLEKEGFLPLHLKLMKQ